MRKLWDFLLDIGNVTINSEESRNSTIGLIPEVVKHRSDSCNKAYPFASAKRQSEIVVKKLKRVRENPFQISYKSQPSGFDLFF